jgi:DNA-binding beta-propeller fold protein YncE
MKVFVSLVSAASLLFASVSAQRAADYLVYVASEAADSIAVLRFVGSAFQLQREIPADLMPVDNDGPHGLGVSPDGRSIFVSLAHGQPNGRVLKYSSDGLEPAGQVTLGMFPASLHVSPSGEFVYVVNFNLHGRPEPSTVSVVHAQSLLEIARIRTCAMPHGSRFSPDGARHYSVCMMSDLLIELDTAALSVRRHFRLSRGAEGGGAGLPSSSVMAQHADHGATATATAEQSREPGPCSPTWAQPSSNGRQVFVACNGTSELVEVDVDNWTVRRRLPARPGIYNIAVTRNGRLIVTTNRRDQSVSIVEIATGREVARLATPRRAVHGVVISRDDRYAFVSSEGIAAETGSVLAIDLTSFAIAAAAEVAPQAGGIDVVDR